MKSNNGQIQHILNYLLKVGYKGQKYTRREYLLEFFVDYDEKNIDCAITEYLNRAEKDLRGISS